MVGIAVAIVLFGAAALFGKVLTGGSFTANLFDSNKVPAISRGIPIGGTPISPRQMAVKEQVKCLFANSNKVEKCYLQSDNNTGCSGSVSCTVGVSGTTGQKMTWKSSCGGYAETMMDGNSEYAQFNCPQAPEVGTVNVVQVGAVGTVLLTGPSSYTVTSSTYNNQSSGAGQYSMSIVPPSGFAISTVTGLNNKVLDPNTYYSQDLAGGGKIDFFVNYKQASTLFDTTGPATTPGSTGPATPTQGYQGACVIRDENTNLPNLNDPSVGNGYSKLNKPGTFADINAILSACSKEDYANLFKQFCDNNSTKPGQQQVALYLNGNPYSTGASLFDTNFEPCATPTTSAPTQAAVTPVSAPIIPCPNSMNGIDCGQGYLIGGTCIPAGLVNSWNDSCISKGQKLDCNVRGNCL